MRTPLARERVECSHPFSATLLGKCRSSQLMLFVQCAALAKLSPRGLALAKIFTFELWQLFLTD